jgi:hypothetical protein
MTAHAGHAFARFMFEAGVWVDEGFVFFVIEEDKPAPSGDVETDRYPLSLRRLSLIFESEGARR